MSSRENELNLIVAQATRPLEIALMYDGLTAGFGEDLQLRYSYCGVATAALQRFLVEHHDIETDRVVTQPENAPRLINQRHMAHVVLRHEGLVIDPTYSQFLSYVGVTPTRVLDDESLRALYPEKKIAVFNSIESDEFADSFASIAHDIDQTMGAQLMARSFDLDENLIGATLEAKRDVYQAIWSPDGYSAFPLREQSSLQGWVGRMTTRMNQVVDRERA